MKRVIAILFLFTAALAMGQEQDSTAYYSHYNDSIVGIKREKLRKLCVAARLKYPGDGLFALYVDSLGRPLKGMEVDLIRCYFWTGNFKLIKAATTDSNGACIFSKRGRVKYNLNVNYKTDGSYNINQFVYSGKDLAGESFVFYQETKSESVKRMKWWFYNERKDAKNVSSLHNPKINTLQNFKLVDKLTGTKFVLDSTQTIITAMDTTGKVLWKTNPRKEANLHTHKISQPIIIFFQFHFPPNPWVDTYKTQMICITYDNSQFGTIDLKTGEFTFMGQD